MALSPDFSIIKFVENKTSTLVNLLDFFNSVLKRESLEIEDKDLEQILCNDLKIDLLEVENNVRSVLRESLMYYMTVWPGWQRFQDYHSGQLLLEDWFDRFRQYLILKTRFVIKRAVQFVQESSHTDTKTVCTQTDVNYNNKRNKEFAPYSLCISGPASVLNNIVFVKSEDNVVIKQYPTKEWQNLKLVELYNWPNICIEVNLPGLSLSRAIAHQVHRYMALSGDMVILPEVNHIVFSKKMFENQRQQSYSYEFIQSYVHQFIHILKKMSGIQHDRIMELQKLFSEFLQDIVEVNLCKKTVCTNMSIGFNIGEFRYVRSRKMVKSSERTSLQEIINFYELLIPQVNFALRSLDDEQEDSDKANVSFKYLNALESRIKNDEQEAERLRFLIHHCIIYKCTVCSEAFIGRSAKALLTKHFSSVHKGEQSVLCYKCHEAFNIQQLAGARWKHCCKG